MARPLRIELAGGLYHVTSRGIERRDIVGDDRDRQRWLDWLRRTVETYGWRLHAFVLMDNHHHLFVETPEANLSAGMHDLNGSYTSYFNRRRRRAGHLFQGRYCRFVRVGLANPPPCPWRAAFGGLIVGSEKFVQRIRRLLDGRAPDRDLPQLGQLRCRPPLDRIVTVVAKWFGREGASWSTGSRSDDIGRAVAASLARRRFGYSAKAVAATLGYRAHSSVAMAIARVEAAGSNLKKTLAQIEQKLVTKPRHHGRAIDY